MKNLRKTLTVLVTTAMVFFLNASYALSGNDSLSKLQVNGRVLKASKKEKGGYTVELVQNNRVIGYKMVKPKVDFVFDLEKNSQYKLRVSKVGFLPFVIEINTTVEEGNTKQYAFNFEAQLTPLSLATNHDLRSQNEPIALLKHDKEEDRFYPIEFKGQVSDVF